MAIAFDSTEIFKTAVATTASSLIHVCSGANRYLLVFIEDTTGFVNAATYDSVSMTLLQSFSLGTETLLCFGLANPSTGTNNITVNASAPSTFVFVGISYNGVNQITAPDNKTTGGGILQSSPLTTTITTIADNCWTILFDRDQTGGATAGTGSTFRTSDAAGPTDGRGIGVYDSGGSLTPAGSHSMGVTFSGTSTIGTIMISLAPPGSVVVTTSPTNSFLLLGV